MATGRPEAGQLSLIFDRVCQEYGIAPRLTNTNHRWTHGQVERLNRTRKDATVQHDHDHTHHPRQEPLPILLLASNFAKRLKTPKGLTP
jgi:transposase InsO family protein